MAISSTSPESNSNSTMANPTPTPSSTEPTPDLTHSKSSLETADTIVNTPRDSSSNSEPELEFAGDISTDNKLPSLETLKRIENFSVLDVDGRSVPFRNLYTGPNVAKRVLIIFIRHFFCGNCQEYIRTLVSSITTHSLLSLPTPTFIAVIGHGDPSLIPMYQRETSCPFPIYADPTKRLYNELGMLRTLNLGKRPEYQRRELWNIMLDGFVQSVKHFKGGKALKGGDYHQVGGEFLFEPISMDFASPASSPDTVSGEEKQPGNGAQGMLEMGNVTEKHVTWCHRMRNTRDHAEIPELREVLGLDEKEGTPKGTNAKRWQKALLKRKGTGMSVEGRRSVSLRRQSQLMDGKLPPVVAKA